MDSVVTIYTLLWILITCACIGAIVVAVHVASLLRVFVEILFLRGKDWSHYGAHQGGWAIVTGCTDGIGREMALQLAAKGLNIVLIARSLDKLNAVAKEIGTHTRRI
jgi:17beta-estradiol 17-dehydrogenase / very-long-chain 3-oxoacyl-CoA reductase